MICKKARYGQVLWVFRGAIEGEIEALRGARRENSGDRGPGDRGLDGLDGGVAAQKLGVARGKLVRVAILVVCRAADLVQGPLRAVRMFWWYTCAPNGTPNSKYFIAWPRFKRDHRAAISLSRINRLINGGQGVGGG